MTPTNRNGADDDGLDTIAPAEVTLARAGAAPAADARARRDEDRAVPVPLLAGIAALVVVAAAVVLVLPGAVEGDATRTPATTTADSASAPPSAPATTDAAAADEDVVAPFEEMRSQRERRAAQEVLERLLTLTENLESRAVERWGPQEMSTAQALAEDGDDAFLAQEYETAQALYRRATELLETLSQQGDALAAERLEQGLAAIEAGDGDRAAELFEFVLALEPDSEPARLGAERAAVTEEVLGLVEEARAVATDGALEAARGLLRRALELDAESTPARDFAAELDDRLARADFLEDMSAGYTALRERRFEDAEAAFTRAEAREPGAPEVVEGRRILAAERFAARIESLRSEAETAAEAARWEDAARAYGAALELDGALAFARNGYERTNARAELDRALTETLARPEELNQPGELEAARALLVRGRDVTNPDPRLAGQLETLAELLRLAVIPVPVTLRSDGYTEVRILREANPGRFVETTLELRPGRYVATGTRLGYQDVRVPFVVTPEGTEAPVAVRCSTRL